MNVTSHAELTHFANVEDEATGEAFEVFKYVRVGGGRDRLMVEREFADDVEKVRGKLRKYNAALSPDRAESLNEVKQAIHAEPQKLLRYSASTGWLPDDTAFVTTHRTIDPVHRKQKILPPRLLNGVGRRGAKPAGDIAGWKRDVAGPCGYSDLGVTMLSCAFGAPLLKMTGRHSFGLNAFGLSKTGKSTMLVAASSVAGAGREEELLNWAATPAALGELCRAFCDAFMPINEVGLIKKKEAYSKIQPTIYQVAEGRERERHSKSSFATTDDGAYHRTIFASTSEHPFDYYARLAGETRDEGELARCLDIPAVRNNRSTVIDRFPVTVPRERRRAWARATLKRVRKACELHHGVALQPLIEFVMRDLPGAKRRVEGYMRDFMESLDTRGMSAAMEHAAENCSLICAGGCMAVDADILPYQKKDVVRAVSRCFRDALRTASEESDPLAQAKRTLRLRLDSEVIFRPKSPRDRFDAGDYDGYVVNEGGRHEYVVRAASLRDWFKTEPGALKGIIGWLEEKRCLLARGSRSVKAIERPSDWAERTYRWPDSKSTSVRSIVFYEPFGK